MDSPNTEPEYRPRAGSDEACTPSGLPLRVAVAMDFVRHCNGNMSYSRSSAECECCSRREVVKEIELHYSQEQTFRKALGVLNRYFDAK